MIRQKPYIAFDKIDIKKRVQFADKVYRKS